MKPWSNKNIVRCVGVLTWVTASGCSAGSQDVGTNDPDGGGGANAANSFSQVSGTIGGKSFVPKSGFLHHRDGQNGAVDLVFSDVPDLCTELGNGIVHPGETVLQAYQLQLADASKKSYSLPEFGELKVARVAATCESGAAPVIDYRQDEKQGVDYTITIDDPTVAPVTGTFRVAFQDGSNAEFAFSVPICGASQAEHTTCR